MSDRPTPVVLRHGALECVVVPAIGGAIARLTREEATRAVDLLRPASAQALAAGSINDMACFPLLPYSNRIKRGRFHFNGRDIALPHTMPGCPHAIHGHAWKTPWTIEERSDRRLALTYRHAAGPWPWPYRARQTFTLGVDGLLVELEIANESLELMPAGLGLHPFFPKPPGTRLTAAVDTVWLNDDDWLPERQTALPPAWNLPAGPVMDHVVVDNGFSGWNRRAEIAWPSLGLGLTVEAEGPFGHLVVYAPEDEDFLCVEPVTHMTDAHNRLERTDNGLVLLSAGRRLTGAIRLTARDL